MTHTNTPNPKSKPNQPGTEGQTEQAARIGGETMP
jgi:hypothetical protein